MKGQSLIEVLVAMGIISIVITSVVTIVTTSLGNTQFSRDQDTATKYAQEGLELTRSIRNSSYSAFAIYNGRYCLPKNAQNLGVAQPSCTTPNVDSFIREVQIQQAPGCGANVSKVIVNVSWRDGKCSGSSYCHKSQLVSCLSRINPITIP
jgi:prepilin-type N-terminal cleavage/methylation domain-containing protein